MVHAASIIDRLPVLLVLYYLFSIVSCITQSHETFFGIRNTAQVIITKPPVEDKLKTYGAMKQHESAFSIENMKLLGSSGILPYWKQRGNFQIHGRYGTILYPLTGPRAITKSHHQEPSPSPLHTVQSPSLSPSLQYLYQYK